MWEENQVQSCQIEIDSLLKKGVIVATEHKEGECISPIFTVLKKDGSCQMLFNLRNFNKSIEYCHF